MADEILAKTASASLTAANPSVTIVTMTHTLGQAPSGFAKTANNEIMLESDIDTSFATYTTNYTTPTYATPGTLMYQSLKSVDGLSELTKKDGEAIALKTTTGTITCSLVSPAIDPSTSNPDTSPSYDIDFSITNAGQTLSKSD